MSRTTLDRPPCPRCAVGPAVRNGVNSAGIVECDELWSFVGNKGEQWWGWAAIDADTRQVVAMVCGDRSDATAQCLWDALPDADREGAIIYTDFWSAYQGVIPEGRHAAAGKDAGVTTPVERFWCALRQTGGRSVRKTPPFSKCVENHGGALWYFVRRYNQPRAWGHYQELIVDNCTLYLTLPRRSNVALAPRSGR